MTQLYDINCKVAIGKKKITHCIKKEGRRKTNCMFSVLALFDAGIGEAQMNIILSAINVPTLKAAMLKRYERVVGPVIEAVARESCQENVRQEIALTNARDNMNTEYKSNIH